MLSETANFTKTVSLGFIRKKLQLAESLRKLQKTVFTHKPSLPQRLLNKHPLES